ncbi:low molecular weight protein arginine phosphatase [Thermodesulfobacteriota bacterium]
MNILFVCTGNISRSYLASVLLKEEILKQGLENISVESAGTSAYPGNPGDPKMVEYLSEIEVPAGNHQSRQIMDEHVTWADLILVMEKDQRSFIEEQWPEQKDKVELLGKYISPDMAEDDVVDPYGGTSYHYRLAQSQISLAIKSLINKLITEQNA